MIRIVLTPPTPNAGALAGDYVLAPDVVLVLLDDGTSRLLDLAGSFYALSATATAMLSETLHAGEHGAAERIAARFRVASSAVADDIRRFLNGLEQLRLIGRPGQTRRPASGRLAALVLAPALHAAQALPAFSLIQAKVLLGLARWAVRWFGWAATVAAWRRFHQGRSVRTAGTTGESLARKADAVVRTAAAQHPFLIECKERALTCWLLLRSHGVPARLIVGMDPFPFSSHCWCTYGPLVLTDFTDRCQRYVPVLTYA